jgi:hypothetical protein
VGTSVGAKDPVGAIDVEGPFDSAGNSTKVDGTLLRLGLLLGATLDDGRAVEVGAFDGGAV